MARQRTNTRPKEIDMSIGSPAWDLAQRNAEHGTEIYLLVGEPEAVALVAGFVPHAVRQQARAAIDWEFWNGKRRRRGARGVKTSTRTRQG